MDRVSMKYGIKLEQDSNSSPSALDRNASPHRLIKNTREDWSWRPLNSYSEPMTELSAFKQSFQWQFEDYQDSTHQHNTPSTLANRHGGVFNIARSAESGHGSGDHNFGVNFAFKSYPLMDRISSDFMRLHLARAAGLSQTLFNHDIVDNFMHTLSAYLNDSTMALSWYNTANLNGNLFNRGLYLEEAYIDTVTVDSSTVAQIVGKNGGKIIELVSKHNTIVICPKEGEFPVFEIRGERNVVHAVKEAILKLANHFMALEMSRINQLHILANRTGQSLSKLYVPLPYAGLMAETKCYYLGFLQDNYNVFIQAPKPECQIEHFLILGKQAVIDKVINLLWIQLCTKGRRSFRRIDVNENEVHFDISPITSSTRDTIAPV